MMSTTASGSKQASRRRFVKSGLGACAAVALVRPVPGQPAAGAYYKAIFDERFEESRAFAAGAAARGIATAAVRGDVTSLFFDDLDVRWQQGPIWLAGYTTRASLFCLELLARDRGMRLSHQAVNPDVGQALGVLDGTRPQRSMTAQCISNGRPDLVFWILAPRVRA